ncbi:MAG: hypothetical protein ACREJT_12820, partial [Myxococcota bacterium]
MRRRVALLGLAIALLALTPGSGSAQGCVLQSDCDDDAFCTADFCILFNCVHTARGCDDFNGCTDDGCSEASNRCVHTAAVGRPCSDPNPFTVDDRC